jgi:hypothetical protein
MAAGGDVLDVDMGDDIDVGEDESELSAFLLFKSD